VPDGRAVYQFEIYRYFEIEMDGEGDRSEDPPNCARGISYSIFLQNVPSRKK
jgi:hypothetical protein